jgi:hypothetical protein
MSASVSVNRCSMHLCWLLLCAGCGTSKWAMDDPMYAAKYSKPYGDDKIPRMAKQAIDARFLEGRDGAFMEAGVSGSPATLGGEIGIFSIPQSFSERRAGFIGLLGTGEQAIMAGVDGSLRLHTPTRLAPFVGMGALATYFERDVPAAHDGSDNDDDLFIDEKGEEKESAEFFGAVYPETGIHFWMTPKSRLTASGRYMITTDGRNSDTWYVGLGYSMLYGP